MEQKFYHAEKMRQSCPELIKRKQNTKILLPFKAQRAQSTPDFLGLVKNSLKGNISLRIKHGK